ncbi:MAG: thiolase domain-containing protein [Candidatus Aenigmarchaeota archaeon]|nr:thiolase domain-containing protein [Candidatus Aenigmarchaeota archaeon]
MKNVAIAGVGQTKFGEHWDQSIRQLAGEAVKHAVADANLESARVQALYVGNMSAGLLAEQEHVAALVADAVGLAPIPSTRCEAACASGATALRQAYLAVASGAYDVVAALGVEKMTDLRTQDVNAALMAAGDHEWESSIGLTFAGIYALMARAHMHRFGTTREQLAMVSVINHEHAVGNPYAQFPFTTTIQDVLSSPLVADPLHVLDCSPITDGAACAVIVSERIARQLPTPVWLLASEQASDTVALHDRASLVEMAATKAVGSAVFEKTHLKHDAIDLLEVHDCFSINEIFALEDLGFCQKGGGGMFVEAGEVRRTGTIPTNTMGGLKAIGHPVGATGIRQVVDITKQLRGTSHNQLKNPHYGLALNVGGSGATAVATLLGLDQL